MVVSCNFQPVSIKESAGLQMQPGLYLYWRLMLLQPHIIQDDLAVFALRKDNNHFYN